MTAIGNNTTVLPVVTAGSGVGASVKSSDQSSFKADSTNADVAKPEAELSIQELSSQLQVQEQQKAEKEKPVGEVELGDAVQRINDHMQVIRRDLQFSMDDDAGQLVVKVIDRETEDVVRQIPSEQALELSKRLEELQGMLLEAEV